jgi:putative inorganic carbon (hco3(-)) transporter
MTGITMPRTVMRVPGPLIGAAAIAVGVLGAWVSWFSMPAFVVAAAVLFLLVAYAAFRWPRAALVLVALSAILDRYVVAGLLPTSLSFATHASSESLLAVVAIVITATAWRRGALWAAIWHPASAFLAAFLALALVSALLNRVPPVQGAAGIFFTLDAAVLFYLVRMVGFNVRQALLAVSALVGLLFAAGIIAILQALIRPDILGMTALLGRFGEAYRLASIFGDPNVFAALISAAAPFAAVAFVHAPSRRDRWISAVVLFTMVLPLWLTFSRGGWIGMIAGFSLAMVILDWRVWFVGAVTVGLAFVVATTMPRDLAGPIGGQTPPSIIDSTVKRGETIGAGTDLRFLFIKNAVPILKDHPLLGVGPGMYGGAAADIFGTPIYAEYKTTKLFINPAQNTVDDFWLHILIEAGILGTLAFIGGLLAIGWPILRLARRSKARRRIVLVGIVAATLSLAVNSTTTMLLEANSVAFVFWFLLGLGSSLVDEPPESELAAGQDLPEGPQDDADVAHEGPLLDVLEVEGDPLVEAQLPPGANLPQTGEARQHR